MKKTAPLPKSAAIHNRNIDADLKFNIALNLKMLRKDRPGLTGEMIAKYLRDHGCKTTQQRYSNYENGNQQKAIPNTKELLLLADYYHTTIDALTGHIPTKANTYEAIEELLKHCGLEYQLPPKFDVGDKINFRVIVGDPFDAGGYYKTDADKLLSCYAEAARKTSIIFREINGTRPKLLRNALFDYMEEHQDKFKKIKKEVKK